MVETKQDIEISEEIKLEKEIEEKQQKLHELRYGDMEKAYKDFEEAKYTLTHGLFKTLDSNDPSDRPYESARHYCRR